MKKQCLRFSRILLLITVLFSVIIVKGEPAVTDSIASSSLSFLQAPPDSQHFDYVENPAMTVLQGYAVGSNVWTNELYTFDPDDLATSSVLTGITTVPASGDFAPGDPDHMWLIDIDDNQLKKLNVNSGMVVESFPMPVPLPDGIWSVLTIDPTTGDFYAVATDGNQSVLHQVDQNSGNTNLVLEMAIPAAISGTTDGNGMLYLLDIVNDETWVVDLSIPDFNQLGPAGFDGNFAQGMGYDSSTDRVFLAAYNDNAGPELRLLDRTTGNTTLVGELPGETTGFDFPQSQQAMPDLILVAGQDHYIIPAAGLTFGQDVPQVPEGFFNPGSDPFIGSVYFKGANSNGGEQAQQDLIINRMEDLETPEPLPTEGSAEIQLQELNLISVQPIIVETENGPSQWVVEVQLQPSAPQNGMANILRENLNGGVFDMQMILVPVFVFTNVDDPSIQKIFNPMEFGFTGLQLFSGEPLTWMVPPIPGEFDPIGEEGMTLVTPSGNQILIIPFLVRNDNFFLSMDEQGQPEAWEGTGYNNSEWYYYPFTDWWNVWFYDHPFDPTRNKLVSGNLQIQPRDPALPSYVEIIVNWSTPEWPQWAGYPEGAQPPLPDLMTDPEFENQVIERSETIFLYEDNITEPIPISIPSDYLNLETGLYNFNPEWISIDLRGFNFVVTGELIHICFKPWTGCEVVCPEDMEVCFTDEPFALTGASPAGGSYSGNGVNADGVFDPGNASWGENVITYTYVCPDGTQVSCEFIIYVIPPPEMVCPPNLMLCYGDVVTLSGGLPGGGIYTGPGVSGNTFSSIGTGVGSFEITYSVTDPCPGECVFYITVNPNPEVTCPADFTMCSDDDPIDLMTLVSPVGGTFSGGQIFDPASAPPGVPLQINYTYVDPDTGCEGSCVFYITVWPEPELQCPEDFTLCADDDPVDLMTLVSPQGGTFSGGQIFDPSQAPPGVPLQTWYTYVDPDTGCEATCIFYITVWPTPEVECPDDMVVCESDDPIDLASLGASPAGGTFTDMLGNVVTVFDPAGMGPASYVFTYCYIDPDTGCEGCCEFAITVWPNPEVECPDDFNMCSTDDPIDLMTLVSPSGGSFSGGQIFDPSTAPPGVPLQIKYTYVDPDTGCEGSCVFYITVWPEPELQCPEDFTLCADDDPLDLMTLVSPQGGTFSGGQIFDPSQAPPGVPLQTWYTYVDPDTGCEATCIFYITVWPTPEVECPDDMVVCESDDPIDLSSLGATPAGGTFRDALGNVVSVFDPAGMGPASYVFTYCYIDPDTGCEGCCEFAITVYPNPEIECPEDFTMCASDDPIDLMTLVSPAGGTFSGGQIFDPSTAPPGVPLQTKYTYVDPDTGCESSCVFYITVWPNPDVECPDDFTMCSDDDPIDLMTLVSPTGGTFSGGQIFDPSTAPPGVPLQIKYTYVDPTTGCEASCIFYITVWPNPDVDCPDDKELCIDDAAITLSASPAGGTFSGAGISGDSFDPAIAGVGVHTIEYCYTDPDTGCEGCCEFTITVHDLPLVDCPDDITVCLNDPAFTLTGATPAGGTYSKGGTVITTFNPATAGVGVYFIFYDYTDPQTGCEDWCSFTIEVLPLPDVDCPDDFAVCEDDAPFALGGGIPAGGTYAGPGVAGGNFNPAAAGDGVHTIKYTYTDPATGCSNSCTFKITVHELPDVDCPPNMTVCDNDPAFLLTGATPAGGTYSDFLGNALITFNPALWGAGVWTIYYDYTDPVTGCENWCSFTITVVPAPVVTCPPNFTVCENDPSFDLTGGMPAGGVYTNAGGTTITKFYPATAPLGANTITYTYTDPITGCSNSCTFVITVIELPNVTCPPNQTVCIDNGPIVLGGGLPAGGWYVGPGVAGGVFNPLTAGAGVHAIKYSYTDPTTGCTGSCIFTITVIDPDVDCPSDTAVCENDTPFILTGATPAGGVYSGIGVTPVGGNYEFDPSVWGPGTVTIQYVYTVPGTNCSDTCYFDIIIHENPQVDCPPNDTVCESDPDFPIGGATPPGGVYEDINGNPIGIFKPSWGPGTYPITYIYTDTNGCADSCTFLIVVRPDPVVTCPPDMIVNLTDPPFALAGATPVGGIYTDAAGNAIAVFSPAGAGLGVHPITYSYTDAYGCSDSCTFIIEVVTQGDNLDFGDAPDGLAGFSYNTLLANAGARHIIDPDVYLGDRIDAETDGQPTLAADGDDLAGMDDEDGVTLPASVVPGSTVTISVKASVDGYLDSWMDFNLNGTWMEPGEHIFASQFVVAGMNSLSFTVPAGASFGPSYIRFRFRTGSGAIDYKGLVQNGEVEDYTLQITEEQSDNLDFGDAPDNGGTFNYHTLMANNGARHVINPDVFLGDLIDAEINGQPNFPALGDDNNNLDDEDGVRMKRFMAVGDVAKVSVKASVDGFLNAWVDFNRDGDWSGPGEQIFTDEPLVAGWNTFTFMVPASAEKGRTYARFRYNTTGGLTYEGPAADGEVEDYLVAIFPENWGFEITDLSHLIVVPVDVNQVLKGSDSYSLMPGDFLGTFFQDGDDYHSAGAIIWQGNDNQVLIAYGDDPTTMEKEGFDEGEMMNFKVSVAATGEEFDAQVAFDPDQPNSNGQFQNNGLSALTEIELVGLTQTLELAEGWSGISTYLEPLNTNVEDMFAPVADDLVVLYKLNGSMYWPAQNLNTMGQWYFYDGHVVKMLQDVLLEVNGTEPADKSVQLQEGLNLIPVLSEFPYDVELLFSPVETVLVKEVAGTGVYLPEWGINTIGAVVPGGAYFATISQPGTIFYDLGSNKSGEVYEPNVETGSPWDVVENAPGSHVVVFNLSDNTVQPGDVIGGFTADGLCAGVTAVQDHSFALTLNAADPFGDENNGFEAGEKVSLKLYRESTGEMFELEATYSDSYDKQYFANNGLSEVTGLKATASGTLDDPAAVISIYPNPSSGIFNISNAENVELIEVMDSYGKLVISEKPGFDTRVDLSDYPTGIYFLKAITKDGSESTHKLIVQ